MATNANFLNPMQNLIDLFAAQKREDFRTIVTWKNRYSVSIDDVDNQHKEIFHLLNKYYNRIMQGHSLDEIISVFNELTVSCQDHFSFEEDLMHLYAYPGLYSHKNAHDYFIGELEHMKQVVQNSFNSVSLESVDFIRNWIINHIMGLDKPYSTFLRLRGTI